MSKSFKKIFPIIILVAVFVGLLAVYIIVKNKPEEKTNATEQKITVVEETNTDIESIRYTYNDQTIGFVRNSDGNWVVDGEEDFPLDASKVQVMAGCLGSLKATASVEANGNMADYGLEEPEISITFTAKGSVQTLLVGDEYPYGNERYLSSSNHNGTVFVVSSLIYNDFNKTREDLFKAVTLPTDEADVDTGMAYSYIVDYRRENLPKYGLGEGAEAVTVSYEVAQKSTVEADSDEIAANIVNKSAVYYVGSMTEDGNCYYVNPEGSDYTVAVSTGIIDSFRPHEDEADTDADETDNTDTTD